MLRTRVAAPFGTLRTSIEIMKNSLDNGTLISFASLTPCNGNESRFKRTGKRDEIFLATKFGFVLHADPALISVNGKPEYAKECLEKSLRKLGVDHIDLWYLHR